MVAGGCTCELFDAGVYGASLVGPPNPVVVEEAAKKESCGVNGGINGRPLSWGGAGVAGGEKEGRFK